MLTIGTTAGRNRNIEHLRAIAILFVLCYHFTWMRPGLPTVLWNGWSGVDLFFAISGFVIASSLARDFVPTGARLGFLRRWRRNQRAIASFYVRRLWRIFPPLLVTLALAALLTAFFEVTRWRDLSVEIAAALSMTYNYVMHDGGPFLLDVLWSLALEFQFYLLLPLFFLALSTNRQRLVGALAVFLIVGGLIRPAHILALTSASQDWLAVRISTHCRLDSLAAGVLVFELSQNRPFMDRVSGLSPFVVRGLAFICIMALLLIASTTPVEFSHSVGFSLIALAAAGSVLLAVGGHVFIVPPGVASGLLCYIGRRSFSLYLVHRLCAAWFFAAFPKVVFYSHLMGGMGLAARAMQCGVILALTFSSAELMYRFVERPGIEAGRRHGGRTAPALGADRVQMAR